VNAGNVALEAMGVRLRLVAPHAAVRDILRAEGLEERVGYFGRRVSWLMPSTNYRGGTGAGGPAPQIAPAK